MNRSELEAVLFNLLTNAIKAVDSEGHDERRIKVSGTLDEDQVLIRFEDNGTGIGDDIRDRIFDPFVTSVPSGESVLGAGTGLGLKIVSDIAEEVRGSVRLGEPSEGYSTCLEFRVPAMDEVENGD